MKRLWRIDSPLSGSLAALAVAIGVCAFPARTAADPGTPGAGVEPVAPAAIAGDFHAALVIDAQTGTPLIAYHERERHPPASMLKMMTELLVLERIAQGELKMSDPVLTSGNASKIGGSQVYLKEGEQFPVEDLLMALAIHSANDAATALAEHLAGSTEAFVDLMNIRADELGMTDTEFHSVHGLPAGRGQQPDITSARDMAILGRELIKHPEALQWSSQPTAPFRGGEFTLFNPNRLLGNFRGLDGIKTGYTEPAGYCITASAMQKGKRLISVVMGCASSRSRATETSRLLTQGFNMYTQVTLVKAGGEALPQPLGVKGGKQKTVAVAYGGALTAMVLRQRQDQVKVELRLPEKVNAPLANGAEVGQAVAVLDGVELGSVPIVTTQEIAKGNWIDRLFH